jgi:hypothetical protein
MIMNANIENRIVGGSNSAKPVYPLWILPGTTKEEF